MKKSLHDQTNNTETYTELKNRHQKEVNAFPLRAAFNKVQLKEVIDELGVKSQTELISIGYGVFIRKNDADKYLEMCERHCKERKKAIDNDKTGEGFIYQMFLYELNNHEFGYTHDDTDTIDALELNREEIDANSALLHGLIVAKQQIYADEGSA